MVVGMRKDEAPLMRKMKEIKKEWEIEWHIERERREKRQMGARMKEGRRERSGPKKERREEITDIQRDRD